MSVGAVVAQSTPITGWQIASTIATATAALVALAVAVQNLVQRERDRKEKENEGDARSLAQARLVVIEGKGYKTRESGQPGSLSLRAWVVLHNHGDRAILDPTLEVWPSYATVSDKPATGRVDVLPSGDGIEISARMKQSDAFKAFRVRWTDADGTNWYVELGMDQPAIFTGQLPTARN